jgi:hypothetical protein
MPKVEAMTTRNPQMMMPDFEQLLDVYGAERTLWPLNARAGAAALLVSSAEARQLKAEAAALDAVLAQGLASEPPADVASTSALAARIVAAASTAPRLAASVVAHVPVAGGVDESPMRFGRVERDVWRGAALLAASLMLGVFVGQSQLGAHALPQLAALAGVSVSSGERVALADIEFEASDVD